MATAQPGLWKRHEIFETNSIVLLIGALLVVAIGGLVEITPLFYLKSTVETVEGVRPYTPLELAGRNIYIREGCYLCHSQMVRPMRDEVERPELPMQQRRGPDERLRGHDVRARAAVDELAPDLGVDLGELRVDLAGDRCVGEKDRHAAPRCHDRGGDREVHVGLAGTNISAEQHRARLIPAEDLPHVFDGFALVRSE